MEADCWCQSGIYRVYGMYVGWQRAVWLLLWELDFFLIFHFRVVLKEREVTRRIRETPSGRVALNWRHVNKKRPTTGPQTLLLERTQRVQTEFERMPQLRTLVSAVVYCNKL